MPAGNNTIIIRSHRNVKDISNLYFHLQPFSSNIILKLSPICLGFFFFSFLLTKSVSVGVMIGVRSSSGVEPTTMQMVFVNSPLIPQH